MVCKYLFLFLVGCVYYNCATSTYYLVRHAEKLDNSADTPLSPAGFKRAAALRDSLINKGLDTLLASKYLRTRQTAQPLADALGKPLAVYSPDTTWQLSRALEKMKGKNVLVVGHSNTIPEIVRELTGDTLAIADNDFNNLFIVKIERRFFLIRRNLYKRTYGAVSP
jgi:broad specificity phosphatase PhoE